MPSLRASGLLPVVLWMGPVLVSAQDVETELLELHREFVTSQMVEQDPSFLLDHSHPSYRVVAPGGVLEDRDEIIAGLRAFTRIDSVSVSRERVVLVDQVAVVFARLEVHGEIMGPAAGFGPLTTSTVFLRDVDGEWVVISRSTTPCHPMAVEAGRC